ncbi:MAG TPA: hypothetical protein DCS17_03875 [Flavobacterium sp.]|nr:hypothetical protein [Flavobacterium sp.]
MDLNTLAILETLNVNVNTIEFFKKREIPKNNLYWNKGEYYIGKNTKFIIVPLFYELFQRVSKIEHTELFKNIEILEELLHNTESEEMKIISYNECVNKCKSIHRISEKRKTDVLCKLFIDEIVLNYPQQEALRRGNFMLYYFLLHFDDNQINELKTISFLFLDFVSCGLIVDDFFDTESDLENKEPNTINELGGGIDAMKKVEVIYKKASENIMMYYPELKIYYDNIYSKSASYFLSKLKLW